MVRAKGGKLDEDAMMLMLMVTVMGMDGDGDGGEVIDILVLGLCMYLLCLFAIVSLK